MDIVFHPISVSIDSFTSRRQSRRDEIESQATGRVRFVSDGKKGFPTDGTGAMDWIQPLTQSLRRVGFPKRPASLLTIVDGIASGCNEIFGPVWDQL